MKDLSDNHKKVLLIRFRHIDSLLTEFESILDVVIPRCPLQQYRNDISQEMRKQLEARCDAVRAAMLRILKELGIDIGKPDQSVLKYLSTSIEFADMAIEELRPKYIRGYGALSDAAKDDLNAIADELQGLLKQIKTNPPKQ